jgi:hypothetical protein
MTFPTTSFVFRDSVFAMLDNASPFDLKDDTWKYVLYNNSATHAKDDTTPAYNTGGLTNANEFSNGGWAAGGQTLANKTLTKPSSGVVMWDADDPVSSGAVTGSNIYGGVTIDTTASNLAFSSHYFGGPGSVTASTLQIALNALGLTRFTS